MLGTSVRQAVAIGLSTPVLAGKDFQFFSELPTSPKHTRFGCLHRDPEFISHLPVCPTFPVVKEKSASKHGIQTEHGLQCELAIHVLSLAVFVEIWEVRNSAVAIIHTRDLDTTPPAPGAIPAERQERLIECYAKQPGGEP